MPSGPSVVTASPAAALFSEVSEVLEQCSGFLQLLAKGFAEEKGIRRYSVRRIFR